MEISEERYRNMLNYAERKRAEIGVLEQELRRARLQATPAPQAPPQIVEVQRYADMEMVRSAFNAGTRLLEYWDAQKPFDVDEEWEFYKSTLVATK